MPTDRPLTPDDLDAWLDGREASVPSWLPALQTRLRDLDTGFAPATAARVPHPGAAAGIGPTATVVWERPARGARVRHTAVAAAVVALLIAGLTLAARFLDQPKPEILSIAAVPAASTATEAAVDAFTVTPTSCDLPALSDTELDTVLAGATPLTDEAYVRYLVASRQEIASELSPGLVDGDVVVSGGAPVEPATANEVRALLGRYLACVNAGDGRVIGLYSPRLLRLLPQRAQLYAVLRPGAGMEGPVIGSLTVTHLRRLADGRVVASLVFPTGPTADSVGTPAASPPPANGGALDGVLYVFTSTDEGWRVDLTIPGDVRLPPPATPTAG